MEIAVLENEAMKLSVMERAVLADRLVQTLGVIDEHVMKAWADEGERRLASFKSGEISALDGESLVQSLRKSHG